MAVVVDLGGRSGVCELQDQARAAGAARRRVLDVRDDFIRECMLPDIHSDGAIDNARCGARARDVMTAFATT